MKKPHKHADVIKAWADGEKIEFFNPQNGRWRDYDPVSFCGVEDEFRIKPEPKPDIVHEVRLWMGAQNSVLVRYNSESLRVSGANLRLTFDGESGRLKLGEILS